MYCFGSNYSRQLGDGTTTDSTFIRAIEYGSAYEDGSGINNALEEVIDIAAGAHHNCVIVRSRNIFCWGSNSSNQIGWNGQGNIAMMALSSDTTCVVFKSRLTEIQCRGRDDFRAKVFYILQDIIKLTAGYHHYNNS